MRHKSYHKSHHKIQHKRLGRMKKKYKRLAVALAGAAIMSSSMLPGMPVATAHAATIPAAGDSPLITTQQMINTDKAGNPTRLNTNAPAIAEAKQPAQAKADTNQKQVQAKLSSANAPSNYQKALNVTATAYAPGAADNGQWGNKTHLGTQVRPGVIAVDPKIIPLGSRVFIQYPDGRGEYAVAEDTGGAIKGNRIDVAKWSRNQAKDFGIQNVKVYVLSSPKKI